MVAQLHLRHRTEATHPALPAPAPECQATSTMVMLHPRLKARQPLPWPLSAPHPNARPLLPQSFLHCTRMPGSCYHGHVCTAPECQATSAMVMRDRGLDTATTVPRPGRPPAPSRSSLRRLAVPHRLTGLRAASSATQCQPLRNSCGIGSTRKQLATVPFPPLCSPACLLMLPHRQASHLTTYLPYHDSPPIMGPAPPPTAFSRSSLDSLRLPSLPTHLAC